MTSASAQGTRPGTGASRALDLNSDVGESFGVYRHGDDEGVLPLITSANIACGAHAGDPRTMRTTVELAARHGVAVGAHVGLADREGFGRRLIPVSAQDVHDLCLAQMGALDGFLRAAALPMAHLKLHGALYVMANADPRLAEATCRAVTEFDAGLAVFALPGSALATCAAETGLRVVEEFFADRPYRGDEVQMFGWDLDDLGAPQDAADRVGAVLDDHRFAGVGTVCVHSDTPGAPGLLTTVRARLQEEGCAIAAPER